MATERDTRQGARRPAAWPVAAGAVGAFFAAFAFLAGQVRAGEDPALGPAPPARPATVIVRRIERRVVVAERPRRRARAPQPEAPAPEATPAPLTTRSS